MYCILKRGERRAPAIPNSCNRMDQTKPAVLTGAYKECLGCTTQAVSLHYMMKNTVRQAFLSCRKGQPTKVKAILLNGGG